MTNTDTKTNKELTTKEIEKAVAEYFDYSYNFEVIELITSAVRSVIECKESHDKDNPSEEFDAEQAMFDTTETTLIYNRDLVTLAENAVINITIDDGIFTVTGTDNLHDTINSIVNSLGVEL